MEDYNILKEVAQYIGATHIEKDIDFLSQKSANNCPLVLPLVGEYSSGKTTLINALTDSKQLETAVLPTTATIYEIHFGQPQCKAEVYFDDGTHKSIENITDLHNSELTDATVVDVSDTSRQVPESIVLVDTPGLSSPDIRHKQTLVNFLPNADGILLVADIHQQLTRSLLDFIKSMELSKRRIYLVLTKSDLKSPNERGVDLKKNIELNNGIPSKNIVVVSAKQGDVEEFKKLLNVIQADKSQILTQVNQKRAVLIARQLMEHIQTLLTANTSDKELEQAILDQESKKRGLKRNLDKLIDSIQDDINEIKRKHEREFEDTLTERLEILVANRDNDFDRKAVSLVNNTSTMIVANLREAIKNVLYSHVQNNKVSEDDFSFDSIVDVDLSKFAVNDLSYNLSLNTIGHEYDDKIAIGVKVAAVAALVAVAAPAVAGAGSVTAGAAEVGAAEAGTAGVSALSEYGAADFAADAIGAAVDLAMDKKINDSQESNSPGREQIMSKYEEFNQQENEISQKLGMDKGIVISMVGLVTDQTMGKPQRRRAIHQYMDATLMPKFNSEIERNISVLLSEIKTVLFNEASVVIDGINASLLKLKEEKQTKEENVVQKIKQLKKYSEILNKEFLCGNF